ncbi:(2Fe-2S)-binding protein [Paraburkholderia phytofirmans]|uniref:Sarcosine oxidase alpha subunit n=1 Tax=Paraburkholderia phytofirmans (strain DSM 17436 / LMG 22146 / PsJN) TaxID=398527 RepID=B2TB95_PARPJ|nr:(2Fe-2S)-binding protein [Paraburkholderia phytofirmans]ACD20837.1 hypothetical protein Bphyt_6534 [Paraburkholderia phytofirmans PsJN]
MFRKLQDPSLADTLQITVDGEAVGAMEGETVAGVLMRRAVLLTRQTPVSGMLRAPYCMMGVCFECLAVVDGIASVQTCLTTVRDGMCVERQRGRRTVELEVCSGRDFTEDGEREAAPPREDEAVRDEKKI